MPKTSKKLNPKAQVFNFNTRKANVTSHLDSKRQSIMPSSPLLPTSLVRSVHPTMSLTYTTYNILSTFRTIEVKEDADMVSKRYGNIINQIIENNSDFYVLQEIDKLFEEMLKSHIISKPSEYNMTKPKYFNKRPDTIGVVIVFKKSVILVEDLTEICQTNYKKINKSVKFVPFRGQCCLFEYNSIPIIVSTIHHSRQGNGVIIDGQLQKTLSSIINTLYSKNCLHYPFILGGDFYYSGDTICHFLSHQVKMPYIYVPIGHRTSYHKYHKPSFSMDKIQIRKSSNTTDQIIFSPNLNFLNYNIFPNDGMGREDDLPYTYANLSEKTDYTQADFDKVRKTSEFVFSDHAMVTAGFNLTHPHMVQSAAFGSKRKSRKRVKRRRKAKNKRSAKKAKTSLNKNQKSD